MPNKFVRVTAQHIVRDGSEPGSKLQFDMKIDSETKAVLGKWNIFGIWGSYSNGSNGIYPFTIIENGNVDYGTGWDEERFGETNIREKLIEPGTYFEFKDTDGEVYIYGIKVVAVLGEG